MPEFGATYYIVLGLVLAGLAGVYFFVRSKGNQE
jgi:LPXTG-motif cell wall-anchored protein